MSVITRILLLVIAGVVSGFHAHAAEFSPEVQDVHLLPGSQAEFGVMVKNTSVEMNGYSVDIVVVELGSEEGDYNFLPLSDELADWLALNDDEFSLLPGGEAEVVVSLAPVSNIPSEAFVIGVRVIESPVEGSGVMIQTGFISLAFIELGDDLLEDIVWSKFIAERTSIFTDIKTSITLKNDGEKFAQPLGSIALRSWTGREIGTYEFNSDAERVAEGQEKTFEIQMNSIFALGPYHVDVQLQSWQGSGIYVDSTVVWLFSPFSIGFLIILLILLLYIWKYARYK